MVYERWPVEVVDIAGHIPAWSGGGLYHPPHQAGGGAGRSEALFRPGLFHRQRLHHQAPGSMPR
jgi:hypothetical protein